MRFPIDAKTGKPYGMPKGVKADQPERVDLEQVNRQKLAAASMDVEERKRLTQPEDKVSAKDKGKAVSAKSESKK